jgi:hypothetical protein
MAYEWRTALALAAPGFAAALFLALLGGLVLRSSQRRDQNLIFGVFASLMAFQELAGALTLSIALANPSHPAIGVGTVPFATVNRLFEWTTLPLPLLFLYFTLVFPWKSARVARLGTAPAVAVATLSVALIGLHETGIFDPAIYSDERGSLETPLGFVGMAYTLLTILSGLGVLAYKQHAARTEIERERGRLVLSAFALLVAVHLLAVAIPFLDLEFGLGVRIVISIATATFALFVAYAILRYQALDVELRLQKGLSYSATLLVVTLIWVAVGELLEGVVGDLLMSVFALNVTDTAAGVISALLTFPLIAPVQRGSRALVTRLSPGLKATKTPEAIGQRSLDIYTAALEEAWGDGVIKGREQEMLAILRVSLGVTREEHDRLEGRIRQQLGYEPEPDAGSDG